MFTNPMTPYVQLSTFPPSNAVYKSKVSIHYTLWAHCSHPIEQSSDPLKLLPKCSFNALHIHKLKNNKHLECLLEEKCSGRSHSMSNLRHFFIFFFALGLPRFWHVTYKLIAKHCADFLMLFFLSIILQK